MGHKPIVRFDQYSLLINLNLIEYDLREHFFERFKLFILVKYIDFSSVRPDYFLLILFNL